jgi:hypothetical protein
MARALLVERVAIAKSIEPREVVGAGALDARSEAVPASSAPYGNYGERAGWDLASLMVL